MPEPTFSTDPATTTTLDVSEGSAVAGLYRVALGPVNSAYYLNVFARFEAGNRAGPSWNWAACLATLNWMVFRQLWGVAGLYAAALAGAAVLLQGLAYFAYPLSDTARWCFMAALGTVAFLAPGFWGNALLHARLRKKIDAALAATDSVQDASVGLNRQASSRQRLAWLALANAVLFGAAAGAWIAFSQTTSVPAVAPPTPAQPVPVPLASPAAAPAASAASTAQAAASTPLINALLPVSASSSASATVPASAVSSAMRETAAASIPGATAEVPAASAPAPAASQPAPTASIPASKPAQVPARPAAALPKTAASAPALAKAGATQRYFINVGLFAQESNARAAHAKLQEAGLPAFTQEIDGAKGKRTRVRVGPFATRAEAGAAANKILELKLDAMVVAQ